jgi:hypothetical protein
VGSSTTSSQYLYRILSFDRLVQMLKTDCWYFAHPRMWPDPFERRVRNPLYSALFAQCWCRKGVSDAMWRIYSPNGLGVRVRTRQALLAQRLLSESLKHTWGIKVKAVRYVSETEYHAINNRNAELNNARVTFTRASAHLFLKRKAFEHEAEVRAVVFDPGQPLDGRTPGLSITMDTRQLIDSVLVDPRAPSEYVEMYSHYLKRVLGFPGRVAKSRLYEEDATREA